MICKICQVRKGACSAQGLEWCGRKFGYRFGHTTNGPYEGRGGGGIIYETCLRGNLRILRNGRVRGVGYWTFDSVRNGSLSKI